MLKAYLVIKDGPVLPGVPFGYSDEAVSAELGKLEASLMIHF